MKTGFKSIFFFTKKSNIKKYRIEAIDGGIVFSVPGVLSALEVVVFEASSSEG